MLLSSKKSLKRTTSVKPTELHVAVATKNLEALRSRLKKRPAKTEVLCPDSQDRIPLVAAIQANLPLMVEELLRFYRENNTPVNHTDSHGNTVLHCACMESLLDERIVNGLLKHPGVDVRAQNVDGNTPMHFFCEKFSSPLCQDYVDRLVSMGADVNAANNFGETLLHKACLNNRIRLLLVEILIGKGADPNKTNQNGEGPLHFAVRMGREDLVNVLLKAGADVNARDRRENKRPSDFAQRNKRILTRLKKVEELWAWLESLSPEIHDLYHVRFCAEELFLDVLPMAHDKMLERIGVKEIHRAAILAAAQKLPKPEELASATSMNSGGTMATGSGGGMVSMGQGGDERAPSGPAFPLPEKWKIKPSAIEWTKRAGASKEKERIGAGTSGKVFKAILNGKESVAVKILKPFEEKDAEEFAKEFEIMCCLRHPYIVKFYGACEVPLSLVMEYCQLGTLYEVLNSTEYDIDWRLALKWVSQYTSAMVFVHNYVPQVLHRDFKSLNILVTSEWDCRVSDFGLSRFNTTTAFETLKQTRGTLTHMAPEVSSGLTAPTEPVSQSPAGPGSQQQQQFFYTTKSDVYSMGIVMWEVVKRCVDSRYSKPWFSEFPSLAGMELGIIFKAQQGIRPTLQVSDRSAPVQGTVPSDVSTLYLEAVAQSREDRPSADQMLERVEALRRDFEAHVDTWEAYRRPKPPGSVSSPTIATAAAAGAVATSTADAPHAGEQSSWGSDPGQGPASQNAGCATHSPATAPSTISATQAAAAAAAAPTTEVTDIPQV